MSEIVQDHHIWMGGKELFRGCVYVFSFHNAQIINRKLVNTTLGCKVQFLYFM